jgi:NitT/TauT family transport system permease protein
MDNRKHIHHTPHHFGFSYPTSLSQRAHSAFAPLGILILLFVILRFFSIFPVAAAPVSLDYIGWALLATLVRLFVAYIFALVLSVPLALLINKSPLMERIFLPVFDIAQSIPVLAFFPVVIVFFLRFGIPDGAAIFIIFLSMLWNIVFSLVGGMKVIPTDIKDAAHVFGIRGRDFLRRILIPATVPYLVTGSLLAWAQGWNIIIVAEVLHTYIPGGVPGQDLFGIGSILVNASSTGANSIFIIAILAMVGAIALMNFFVWQKLLHFSERFKFE